MVRLVLFDIDGTLIRTGGAGVKAFAQVLESEFNALDGFSRVSFAGRTDVSLVREFFDLHRIPITPENCSRFFERYTFQLDHNLRETRGQVCPGVWDFLCQLHALPEPPLLGLLTGNIRMGAEIKLRHFHLWDQFVTGAFADDHEDRNQIAAVAHRRGCKVLGHDLRGDEVLVVGDTPLDVRCARAIGARALAVATGGSPLAELLASRADWAVPDLTHVTAAQVAGRTNN
jgi:phosphoglycolate phosphatase-like HAD superfamily hydrolase